MFLMVKRSWNRHVVLMHICKEPVSWVVAKFQMQGKIWVERRGSVVPDSLQKLWG